MTVFDLIGVTNDISHIEIKERDKAEKVHKTIYAASGEYDKDFDCVLWKDNKFLDREVLSYELTVKDNEITATIYVDE